MIKHSIESSDGSRPPVETCYRLYDLLLAKAYRGPPSTGRADIIEHISDISLKAVLDSRGVVKDVR